MISLRQQAGKPLTPRPLSGFVSDQILPDLDQHVIQAAALGMDRNGIVRRIAYEVRLVFADGEPFSALSSALRRWAKRGSRL